MKTEIVFEDKDILVIRKPAGLATQTSRVGQADVVSELKNYLAKQSPQKGQPYLGVIHRLDQPVEGLLVFAKNKSAAAALTKQLTEGGENALNKQYLAVLCGKPGQDQGELVDHLVKKEMVAEVVDPGTKDARKAVLSYKIIGEDPEKNISLAEITIQTGRFHQIRVQMSHAGYPLLGDGKYPSEESKLKSMELMVRNVALCANRLQLKHPTTGKDMTFTCEPEGKVFKRFEV